MIGMSLRGVHLFFIICSSLLAGLLSWWGFRFYAMHGNTGHLILGLLSGASVLALVVYGVWFFQKLRHGRFR